MTPSELLTQVTDPNVIRAYFDWHEKQGKAVVLMMASFNGHVRARLTGYDTDGTNLMVVCTGVRDTERGYPRAYTLLGTSDKGANFLASGEVQPISGTTDCFKLSFPERIDLSQSRDSYRCPAPASCRLRFSLSEPYQSGAVCRVHNVSLGGLAVEWDSPGNLTMPQPGTIVDDAILLASDSSIMLGNLRIAHAVRRQRHLVLGFKFERDAPRQYGTLVLNAQRSQYLA